LGLLHPAGVHEAANRSLHFSGVQHHVDHIIPLCGENVSGLHVETNLQVISATLNLQKKNKFLEAA
jgi:hypothetical protein